MERVGVVSKEKQQHVNDAFAKEIHLIRDYCTAKHEHRIWIYILLSF